jgi:exonuclease VII large subunit
MEENNNTNSLPLNMNSIPTTMAGSSGNYSIMNSKENTNYPVSSNIPNAENQEPALPTRISSFLSRNQAMNAMAKLHTWNQAIPRPDISNRDISQRLYNTQTTKVNTINTNANPSISNAINTKNETLLQLQKQLQQEQINQQKLQKLQQSQQQLQQLQNQLRKQQQFQQLKKYQQQIYQQQLQLQRAIQSDNLILHDLHKLNFKNYFISIYLKFI